MIIQFNTNQQINWAAKGIERRIQNINNALNTYRHEVGYDRTLGRDPSNLDLPLDRYIAAAIAETYEIVPLIDSKTRVVDVISSILAPGDLALKVVIDFE